MPWTSPTPLSESSRGRELSAEGVTALCRGVLSCDASIEWHERELWRRPSDLNRRYIGVYTLRRVALADDLYDFSPGEWRAPEPRRKARA